MSNRPSDLSALARPDAGAAGFSPPQPSIPEPQARWRTRLLLPAALLLACGGLLAYTARASLWPALEVRVVPVVVKAAADGSGMQFQAPGWLEADPYPTHATALADGVIREILVLEGQRVEAGQPLARLIDDDARLALARAEASLLQAEAAARAAQRDWDHPVERKRAVAQHEARLDEARAALLQQDAACAAEAARVAELAEQLERENRAGAGEAIPEFQVVQTRMRLATQRAQHAAATARRPVLEAQTHQAEAELEAAREQLKLRIPETQALETARAAGARALAERDEARLRLERMTVKAPCAGVVQALTCEPGAKVMLGADDPHAARIARLYDPARLQARVDVPLASASQVAIGQRATISVEALPGRNFDGEVTRVRHEADIQKNTLQVKVALKTAAPELKPEMLARVQFAARASAASTPARPRVFAPQRLLLNIQGTAAQAWLLDKGASAARLRQVTLGSARVDDWVEIAAGLEPGDALIDAPPAVLNEGLSEGMRVKVMDEPPAGEGR